MAGTIGAVTLMCLTQFLLIACEGGQDDGSAWVAPDAWSRATKDNPPAVVRTPSPTKSTSHGQAGKAEKDFELAKLYYAKLLRFIFLRKRMRHDPFTDSYSRPIIFRVSAKQLEVLENSNDPRDWDNILSEILPNSELPEQTFKNEIIEDIVTLLRGLLMDAFVSTEIRFALLFLLFLLAIIYLKNRYKYGVIAIILVGAFSLGLINAYYECNKELEISRFVEGLSQEEDPCANIEQSSFSWFIFRQTNTKAQCVEYLKKKHTFQLPYCRPDVVILQYFNGIFFDQMFVFAEKSSDIFRLCFDKLSFPYNYIAILVFGFSLPQFVKLIFKYIVAPLIWAQWNHPKSSGKQTTTGDQLSGENLKLFLEGMKHKEQTQSDLSKITHVLIKKAAEDTGQDLPKIEAPQETKNQTSTAVENLPSTVEEVSS